MAVAEEFVRTHPKEIIVFASAPKAPSDFAKNFKPFKILK
jgi:hypothetical protein